MNGFTLRAYYQLALNIFANAAFQLAVRQRGVIEVRRTELQVGGMRRLQFADTLVVVIACCSAAATLVDVVFGDR